MKHHQLSAKCRRSADEKSARCRWTKSYIGRDTSGTTIDRVSTECRPTIDRLSTGYRRLYRPTVDRLSTECRPLYRIAISTDISVDITHSKQDPSRSQRDQSCFSASLLNLCTCRFLWELQKIWRYIQGLCFRFSMFLLLCTISEKSASDIFIRNALSIMSAIFDWCLPQVAQMADDAHRSKISKLCRLCGKIASSNTSTFKTVKLIQSYYQGRNYALQSKDSHYL